MERDDVLRHYRETGALLEGHFILSSGLRSPVYMQSAKVLAYPDRAEILCRALAHRIVAGIGVDNVDLVCSPAMGGVVVGYEMARQLGVPAIFTERVDGVFQLRRGFEITPRARVVMAEDVITTGKSSRECIECIERNGGVVVAASCLVDRSDGEVDLDVELFSLCGFKVPSYPADALPPELAKLPAVKPGSRGLS
jgi:orotate phosphoribosyltransferase